MISFGEGMEFGLSWHFNISYWLVNMGYCEKIPKREKNQGWISQRTGYLFNFF